MAVNLNCIVESTMSQTALGRQLFKLFTTEQARYTVEPEWGLRRYVNQSPTGRVLWDLLSKGDAVHAKGDRVVVHGLTTAAHHNGKTGVLLQWHEVDRRWVVLLDGEESPYKIRSDNLTAQVHTIIHTAATPPKLAAAASVGSVSLPRQSVGQSVERSVSRTVSPTAGHGQSVEQFSGQSVKQYTRQSVSSPSDGQSDDAAPAFLPPSTVCIRTAQIFTAAAAFHTSSFATVIFVCRTLQTTAPLHATNAMPTSSAWSASMLQLTPRLHMVAPAIVHAVIAVLHESSQQSNHAQSVAKSSTASCMARPYLSARSPKSGVCRKCRRRIRCLTTTRASTLSPPRMLLPTPLPRTANWRVRPGLFSRTTPPTHSKRTRAGALPRCSEN